MNHDVDRPATPTNYEEASSTFKGVVDGNYLQTGCVPVHLCIASILSFLTSDSNGLLK